MNQLIDSNATLWHNISSLMRKHYGKENLSRLAAECDIGLGTASRIKDQKTSVGLLVIDKIATHFHLAAWQLLVPGFDPESPPALQPVNERERKLYERIMSAAKEIANEPDAGKYL